MTTTTRRVRKYRRLRPGDMLRDGDQFWSPHEQCWLSCRSTIGRKVADTWREIGWPIGYRRLEK